MKPASPLPWRHITEIYSSRIKSDDDCTITYRPHTDVDEREDHAFIVHACNLHHDLVAACAALYKTSNDDAARAMAFKTLEKAGVH